MRGSRLSLREVWINLGILLITSIVVSALIVLIKHDTAGAFSWLQTPTKTKTQNIPQNAFLRSCSKTQISAVDVSYSQAGGVTRYTACVTHGRDVSFAEYNDKNNYYRWAVRIGADSNYRIIDNVGYGMKLRLARETNRLIFYAWAGGMLNTTLATFEDIRDGLEPSERSPTGQTLSYRLETTRAKEWFPYIQDGQRRHFPIYSSVVSQNGRYLLGWLNYQGYVKVDFQTSKVTVIGSFPGTWHGGAISNPYANAISNNGVYAFIGNGPTVVDTSGCGYDLTPDVIEKGDVFASHMPTCSKHDYTQEVAALAGYNGYGDNFEWVGDEDGIEFLYQPAQHTTAQGDPMMVTFWKDGATESKLDYLALGDSYSSGEGDTERNKNGDKYYRPYTDNDENKVMNLPREKCHVSTRSYPYVLAKSMNLQINNQWQTVACSGAQTWDIGLGSSSTYSGQGKGGDGGRTPRLDGFDVPTMKEQALNEFIPGRQKQIEFVKRYKPKVITLTAGGNDVDFGGKISTCSSQPEICEYATSEYRSKLKRELLDEYDNLVDLYAKLIKVSEGRTKIYVLGYPQFISADKYVRCKNTFNLYYEERQMISYSVLYMNNVIEAAAQHAGVEYVDVESSLEGHKICQGNADYVTAIKGVLGYNGNELSESFHPNAKGNSALAASVRKHTYPNSLSDYSVCDDIEKLICPDNTATKESVIAPDYFSVELSTTAIKRKDMTTGSIVRGVSKKISGGAYSFAPGSTVSAKLHSKPILLGTVIATDDGSFELNTMVGQNTPVGYHTIRVNGISDSGELVEYYQSVLLEGSNRNDIDGDGLEDTKDKCLFIDIIDNEVDNSELQDYCEPEDVYSGSYSDEARLSQEIERNIEKKDIAVVTANELDSNHTEPGVVNSRENQLSRDVLGDSEGLNLNNLSTQSIAYMGAVGILIISTVIIKAFANLRGDNG